MKPDLPENQDLVEYLACLQLHCHFLMDTAGEQAVYQSKSAKELGLYEMTGLLAIQDLDCTSTVPSLYKYSLACPGRGTLAMNDPLDCGIIQYTVNSHLGLDACDLSQYHYGYYSVN